MNLFLRFCFVFTLVLGFTATSSAQDVTKKRGTMKVRYPNGKIAAKGKVKNYKKRGTWKFWTEQGALHSTAVYVNDTAHGNYTEYSAAGTIVVQGNYCMNLKCGNWKLYDDGGRLIADQNYVKGQFDGIQQYWYPNGKLREYIVMNSGLLTYRKAYFASGYISTMETYKDGMPQGKWRIYSDPQNPTDTFPVSIDEYSNGERHGWHYGYRNGKLVEQFHYANNLPHGGWYRLESDGTKISDEWYTNGQLQNGKYYVKGIIARSVQYEKEKKQGPEVDFNRQGDPIKVTWWTQGVKDSAFIYHSNGRKSSAQYYAAEIAGTKSSYTEWDSAGVKLISGNYENNKKQGEWTTWYPDGRKRSVTNYSNGVILGSFTKWYPNGKKMIEMDIQPDGSSKSVRVWNDKGKQLKEGTSQYNEIVEGNRPGEVYSDPSDFNRKIIDRRIEDFNRNNTDQDVLEFWPPDVFYEKPTDTAEVFSFCELMPEFPGGEDARKKFIAENLKYPNEKDAEGTVYIEYIVERDGSVTNVKILKGIPGAKEFDQAALDVVSKFPAHTPAENNGVTVRCRVVVPIRFEPY